MISHNNKHDALTNFLEHALRMAGKKELNDKEMQLIKKIINQNAAIKDYEQGYVYHILLTQLIPDIPIKKLDKLMVSIFKELPEIERDIYPYLFKFSIHHHLIEFANILIDNDLCVLKYTQQGDLTCLMRILNPKEYDEKLFHKILAKESNLINYQVDNTCALDMAITMNDKKVLIKLLEVPGIIISDLNVRILLDMKDAKVTAALIKQLHNINNIRMHNDLLPVAMMSTTAQEELKIKVSDYIHNDIDMIFKHDPKLRDDVIRFLHSTEPLPYLYMNRLSIIHDFIIYFRKPERIDQYNANLCGIVCVMQHLMMANPQELLRSILAMTEPGSFKSNILSDDTARNCQKFGHNAIHVSELWQEVIRNQYNTVLGYRANSSLSSVTALTRPDQLAQMYRDFGFNIISETLLIRMKQNNIAGKLFDKLINKGNVKVYADEHVEMKSDSDRFDELCKIANQNCYVTILVNKDFMEHQQDMKGSFGEKFILPFEMSHYMIITNFEYNAGTVSFDYMTWGKLHRVNNMQREVFEKCYLGALAAIKNDVKNTLSQIKYT